MPTECSAALFEFARVEGRSVVAGFDGGKITSDAGALLLGASDRGHWADRLLCPVLQRVVIWDQRSRLPPKRWARLGDLALSQFPKPAELSVNGVETWSDLLDHNHLPNPKLELPKTTRTRTFPNRLTTSISLAKRDDGRNLRLPAVGF